MPYLVSFIKKNYRTLLMVPVSIFFFSVFSALFYTNNQALAATDHCVVVADDKQSLTYYAKNSAGCGKGTASKLVALPSVTAGVTTITFAIDHSMDTACSNLETIAIREDNTQYCIQFTPGSPVAFVSKSNKGGQRETYETDVRSAADLRSSTEDPELDGALVNATYDKLKNEVSSFKSAFYAANPQYTCVSGMGPSDCPEWPFKQAVYDCWQSARSSAASAARYAGQAGQQVDQNKLTKEGFATCFSGKLKNVPATAVLAKIDSVDVAAVNTASTEAREQVEESRTPPATEEEDAEEQSSCGVEGLGWLVCPAMSFMGSVTETSFNFLAGNFLELPANYLRDDALRSAWSAMRNLANIAFVIAFMVIIYSQITGAGLGNYGIKKMLPRIIIAAILVNLSLIICQIAIDLSNILGYSLNNLFSSGLFEIRGDVSTLGGSNNASGNGFGIAALVTGLLVGGITLVFSLSIPVLLAALLALLLIVLILFARIALVMVLTIIAPLAFVAFLLPNTEQWFKKWYKMFFALLMVFPIIGVVFGASSLTALIINNIATQKPDEVNTMLQLVALGVATIPLFVVPSLLKGSLNAAGAIGAKLSGMASKQQSAAASRGKNRLGSAYGNSKLGQFNKYRGQQRQMRKSKALSGVDPRGGGAANPLNWGARANKLVNRGATALGSSYGAQSAAMGAGLVNEESEKEIRNATALLDQHGLSNTDLNTLAKGGAAAEALQKKTGIQMDTSMQRAVIRKVMAQNNVSDNEKIIASSGGQSKEVRQEIAQGIHANGMAAKAGYLGSDFSDRVMNGDINSDSDIDNAAARFIGKGKLSAESLVGQDADALGRIANVANGVSSVTHASAADQTKFTSGTAQLRTQAANARSDKELSRKITGQQGVHINRL